MDAQFCYSISIVGDGDPPLNFFMLVPYLEHISSCFAILCITQALLWKRGKLSDPSYILSNVFIALST